MEINVSLGIKEILLNIIRHITIFTFFSLFIVKYQCQFNGCDNGYMCSSLETTCGCNANEYGPACTLADTGMNNE